MDRRAAESARFNQLNLFPAPARGDLRQIVLQGRPVTYRFVRRRRRTLGITIDHEGVLVAAPLRAAWRDIESFLRDKERWIIAKLEEWSKVPRPRQLRGVSGEPVPLFGRRMTLDVRPGGRAVKPVLDRLVVFAPEPRRALDTLAGWLKTCALEALVARTRHFAQLLGVEPPTVGLSNARGQWGVCVEGGSVRLNWRLVHLEPALADYVVAHEVAHLLEMNHSRRFWELVASVYPRWKTARRELELAGAALPIIRGKT